jgi:YYY domain-containing protein
MKAVLTRSRWLLMVLAGFALAVRLFGLNFDQSHYFHPDERRIAEAVTQLSLKPPQLNPHFFAYGSFPIYVTKLVTVTLSNFSPWFSSYDAAIKVGRALSALWGAATVVLLFLLGRRLFGSAVGWLAGLLLSATVLHVQNSHFATNDIPLTFLVLLALAFMVRIVDAKGLLAFAGAGVAVGLAVATKFSALPLFLPLVVAAALRWRNERKFSRVIGGVALATGCALAAFAIAEPYALLGFRAYVHDVLEQSRMVRHAGLFPYTNQYVGVPKVLYDLREMVVWGMGPLLGLAALVGTVRRLRLRVADRERDWVLLAWVVPFFAVTASFDVKFLRYLLPIYPLLVLWGALWLQTWAERSRSGRWARATVVAGTFFYLLAFLAIYTRPHATVSASNWFYNHVPPGSKVLIQDWDEGFPLPLPGRSPESYRVETFPFYDQDTPAKIAHLAKGLASSDYAVLQTKRLYGAVTRAPRKFPLTNNFFRELFAGDLGFTLVQDIASRPGLLGIELPTELADESFSVYDHPKALIFRNTGHLGADAIESKIRNGLPSRLLSRSDLLLARAGSRFAAGGEGDGLLRSSLPATLLCALLFELLGFAAFAAIRAVFPPRAGLYALAKVIGVLVFAYLPWLAVSTLRVPFTQPVLVATVLLMLAVGWLAHRRRREPPPPRSEVVATEFVVWGTFAFFLVLRALNPEIYWGEKPMDFSFLNVLYRSTTLPPPEPWLAGSPLMYTYFGHFVVAAVGKALAIHPAVMFNLGVALVAGLTASALFAAGTVLGRSWHIGATATILTLFAGNLSGIRQLMTVKAVNFDYFWATSRVIRDTINEYPFWSFVFADLHAHLLVMPWAIGFVCLLLLWVGRRAEPAAQRPRLAALSLVVTCALMLGAIMVTNGWSMPTYIALLLAVLGTHWLVYHMVGGLGRIVRKGLSIVLAPSLVIVGGAFVAFRPFWRAFSPPIRQWGREVGPFASPTDFLTIFGLFLLLIVPFFFLLWRRLMAAGEGRLTRTQRLAMGAVAGGLLLSLLDLRALGSLIIRQAPSIRAFALALFFFGLYLALHRRTPERYRLLVLLATFASGLTAGCEFVFVWDRMNTLFKFYLEAWFLFGLSSAIVLWQLLRPAEPPGAVKRLWRVTTFAALGVAFFTAFTGAYGAVTHRHAEGPRWTLDGVAYLQRKSPQEKAAFEWLNRNVPGIPVLVEAYGPSYGQYSRVSMNTGLPIVLGWDYHVFQRGHGWAEINRRKADVEKIYTVNDEQSVAATLARYHVALVYDGPLEQRTYAGGNLANFKKWKTLLTPVYENPGVTIFAVNGTLSGAVPATTVEQVPEETSAASETAAPQDRPGILRQPRGLACDREGNVYVADFGNCRIQKLDSGLKPVLVWGKRGTAVGEFADPCGVAVGPDGLVYVADTWNGRIQVFDASGNAVRQWQGNFFGPRGIAVDPEGRVYVADTGNDRIVRYSPDGAKQLEWGTKGKGPGELYEPGGVAVDKGGHVYVCDNSNGRLEIFDANGGFVGTFDVPGWRREVFSEPYVAVATDGTIWVTVPLASEVRAYSPAGKLVRTIKATDVPAVGLKKPSGIALRPTDGRLLVSDIEGQIAVVSLGQPPAPRVPSAPPRMRPTRRPQSDHRILSPSSSPWHPGARDLPLRAWNRSSGRQTVTPSQRRPTFPPYGSTTQSETVPTTHLPQDGP